MEVTLNGQTIQLGGGKIAITEYNYPPGGSALSSMAIPKPSFRFEKNKYQYNQAKDDPRGCAWYGAFTAIVNNWGLLLEDEDRIWFRNNAHLYGREPKTGMYMHDAGQMLIDRLNSKYPDQQWVKVSLDFYEQGQTYLDMGYMLHIGSIINDKYIDEVKDGAINDVWGKTGMGHIRSMFSHVAYKGDALVENYLGVLPHNVIDIVAMDKIILGTQFYHQCFIYYPSGKMPTAIPFPYMTEAEADELYKKANALIPGMFTSNFHSSVKAWIEAAQTGTMKFMGVDYRGIDGVMKMMIDLKDYRK